MNRNNDQISTAQLAATLSITMIGVGILSLPRTLAEKVGPDAWIVMLAGISILCIFGWILGALVQKFPKETFIEMGNTLVGKFLTLLMCLGLFAYCTVLCAIVLRILGENIKVYVLFNTPIEVVMITFLLSAVYLVRSGIEPIARMSQIIFPIAIFTAVIIVLPVLPELDFTQFLPVFRTPISQLVKTIPQTIFSLLGPELLLLFSYFVIDHKNIKKGVLFSITLVGGLYLLIVVVTIARFGIVETTHSIWPVLELFKTVDLPGAFIENISIYAISIWILSVLMSLVGYYFGASLTLSYMLKSKEQSYLVLPLVPLIFFIALVPDNLPATVAMGELLSTYLGTFCLAVLPIGLFIMSLFRSGKKEDKNA